VRLFVAVELGAAVVDAAMEVVGELRRRGSRLAPRARVTWQAAERLHVTLVFIGRVDPARAAEILDALQPPFEGPPFQMRVTGLGVFAGRGAPRVLWAGIGDGRERLVQLQRDVAARLIRVGVAIDAGPFHPHVTLARVREPAGLRVRAWLDGMDAVDLGVAPVEAITLFESRPSPRGSTYVVLGRTRVGR
jgi:2'-5' RNA ligase